jgi:hypothetical protein
MIQSFHLVLCFVLLIGFLDSSLDAQEMRVWKNKSGKFKIEATFIAATDDSVQIRRADNGKTISVKLEQLSEDDAKYVKELMSKSGGSGSEIKTNTSNTTGAASIRVVDEQSVELVPYGKLPNFGQTFQWVVENQEPVRVVAKEPADTTGSQKRSFKKMTVAVLPPLNAEQRLSLVKSESKAVLQAMWDDGFTAVDYTTRHLEAGHMTVDTYRMDIRGDRSSRFNGQAGSTTNFRFQKDKTILVQSYFGGTESAASDALQCTSKVDDVIMQDKGWLPKLTGEEASKSAVPPKVRREIEALIAQCLKLADEGKVREILAILLPKDAKEELFKNEDAVNEIIKNFKREEQEFRDSLSKCEWEFATYSAEEQSVSFSNTRLEFILEDGKWKINSKKKG